MGKKLQDQLSDHTLDNVKGDQSLIRQFKNISIIVHDQLSQICQQQEQAALENEDEEDAMRTVNIKELVNDFVTDEFEKKNIRVRPTSSLSIKEKKDELNKQSTTLAPAHEEGGMESIDKYNEDQNLEIAMLRRKEKERKRLEEERKQRELEAAEKKKAKK